MSLFFLDSFLPLLDGGSLSVRLLLYLLCPRKEHTAKQCIAATIIDNIPPLYVSDGTLNDV